MIRRPPRSTRKESSAASDVYKRQNKWIAIIKRKNDHIHGFSINGLGFAGYLLVTENSNVNYLKKFGPEKLLESFV